MGSLTIVRALAFLFVRRLPKTEKRRVEVDRMGADYSENLKRALAEDLPALGCRVKPEDISVRERPDGDYLVEVRVRTDTVEIPSMGKMFDTGPTIKETYQTDEALETKGSAYKTKTTRLAQDIRGVGRMKTREVLIGPHEILAALKLAASENHGEADAAAVAKKLGVDRDPASVVRVANILDGLSYQGSVTRVERREPDGTTRWKYLPIAKSVCTEGWASSQGSAAMRRRTSGGLPRAVIQARHR